MNTANMHTNQQKTDVTTPADEDILRADMYGLLAVLLSEPPTRETLTLLKGLSGDDSDLGQGISALARVAAHATPASGEKEYNDLFIGLARGELLPFASFYLTGFLNEKPLAKLRGHMAEIGIARPDGVKEPEDHIASLCEMMAGLIRGEFGSPASIAQQRDFFNTHLEKWAEHFFTDLEGASGSVLYAPVGKIGRAFVQVEIGAFRMEN